MHQMGWVSVTNEWMTQKNVATDSRLDIASRLLRARCFQVAEVGKALGIIVNPTLDELGYILFWQRGYQSAL